MVWGRVRGHCARRRREKFAIWKETSRARSEEGSRSLGGFTIKNLLKRAKKQVFESIFARAVRPKREKTKNGLRPATVQKRNSAKARLLTASWDDEKLAGYYAKAK